MKKILGLISAIVLAVLLVGCTDITDDYIKKHQPAIELKSTGGDLTQYYEENNTLEDVSFEVVLLRFTENEIDLTDIKISWYSRGVLVKEGLERTYTQVVNSTGNIDIQVVVSFTLANEKKQLELDELITVVRTKTSMVISNNIDENNHRINVLLGNNNEVEFNAHITGNLNLEFTWVVYKETNTEPIVINEFDENRVAVLDISGNSATSTYKFYFEDLGNYVVKLQSTNSSQQDANVYLSNSVYVDVNYGEFVLLTADNLVMSENYAQRTLMASPVHEQVEDAGEYVWYLDGKVIDGANGLTYVHNNNDIKGYLYEVHFVTSNYTLKTDPILVVNGVNVSNQEEFDQALEDKVKGIILTDNITYSMKPGQSRIDLNYDVTIYGNNKKLSSLGVDVFINVTKDNVNLSHITIDNANKYNLLFSNVDNGYLENVKLSNIGGSSLTDLLNNDFGSGLFVSRSEVRAKNLEFLTGGLIGVRVDNNQEAKIAKFSVLGNFTYNHDDPVALPIGSGKSGEEGIEVHAPGFDYFSLPAGNITIRRWDNQGEPVTWEIQAQDKTEYELGEYLDLFGVGINVDIGFLGIEIDGADGLAFVSMYIDLFKEYGKIEITSMNDLVLSTYYIVGFYDEQVYGLDNIIYSTDNTLNPENFVAPSLPEEVGSYKVKIYINDWFYLGHIIIDVVDNN